MKLFKQPGFTLIEMVIVLSVIGILVTAFTPQVSQYLEKSKVTQYQNFASEMIKVIQMYRAEIGELTPPRPWSPFPDSSIVCFESGPGCAWPPQNNVNDFIMKQNPKLLDMNFRDKLFNRDMESDIVYFDADMSNWAGYNLPGIDPSSSGKMKYLYWVPTMAPGLNLGEYIYLSGGISTIGKEFDKLCSPGFATAASRWDYGPPYGIWSATACVYIFDTYE